MLNQEKLKWRAVIFRCGKYTSLGLYNNINDAKNAYVAASLKYAQEFSIYSENTPLVNLNNTANTKQTTRIRII